MTEITWTQYQKMMEQQHNKIDKLVNKYCATPKHKDATKWLEAILASGLYNEQDIDYLIRFRKTTNIQKKAMGCYPY